MVWEERLMKDNVLRKANVKVKVHTLEATTNSHALINCRPSVASLSCPLSRASSSRRSGTRRHATTAGRSTTGATTHTRVLVRDTTALVVSSSARNLVIRSRVNTERDPAQNTISNVVRVDVDVLDERIHGVGLLAEDAVVGVDRQLLGVGVVRRGGFDVADERLVKEDLADVGGVGGEVAVKDGEVAAHDGVVGVVGQDVDVSGTAGIMPWEDGFKLHDAVGVGLLDSTEESGVEVGLVVRIAVARGGHARVDTSRVAVPGVDVDGGNWRAGGGVDELDVKVQWNTSLVLAYVIADEFTYDWSDDESAMWVSSILPST